MEEEKEKYYIPNINEFHIGFQYEKYDERIAGYANPPKEFINTNWHRFTYDLNSIRLSQLGTHLFNKTIRVKHLDEDDLQELGFTYDIMVGYRFRDRYTLTLLMVNEDNTKQISYIRKIGIVDKFLNQIMFFGEIKNKSEFIKLLKQLEIN